MARKRQSEDAAGGAAPTLEDVGSLEGRWLRLKWEDSEWYRAVVLRVLDTARGEVFLFYPDSSETEECFLAQLIEEGSVEWEEQPPPSPDMERRIANVRKAN